MELYYVSILMGIAWIYSCFQIHRTWELHELIHIFIFIKSLLISHLCPSLCHPMDCSLQGSSVHVFLQARILEWVAVSFSRRSPWPRDLTQVSCIAGKFLTNWATREANVSFTVWYFLKIKFEVIYVYMPPDVSPWKIQTNVT